jgi:hypothetical protein
MAISGLNDGGAGPLRGLAEIQAELARGRSLPPVEKWNPAHCGRIDMRIARDGAWYYMGTPIARPAMVRLFSTILRREPDGEYVLVTPVEKVGIVVEDLPFLAVTMTREGADANQTLTFLTNVGDGVAAGADHPLRFDHDARTGEPRPSVHVRGRLEARLARPVFYEVADLAAETAPQNGQLGVWSGRQFFAIGPAAG